MISRVISPVRAAKVLSILKSVCFSLSLYNPIYYLNSTNNVGEMHAEMLKVNNHFSNFELQFELKLRTFIVSFLIKVGKYNKVFNWIYKAWDSL